MLRRRSVRSALLLGAAAFAACAALVAFWFGLALRAEGPEALIPPPAATTTPVRVPILVYHSVVPDHAGQTLDQKIFSVTPAELDAQLAYLNQHGYTPISFDDLRADILAGTTSPVAKPVVISFDDGWENQYTYAFPLLKKHHVTATFFVFTNPIGKDDRFLTWSQLKEMEAAGMHVGSHTLSHPEIEKLTPDQLAKETGDSKRTLEQQLGHPITAFASPFGKTTPALEKLLDQEGYTTGRTLLPGTRHDVSDLYRLQAYDVKRTMFDFSWYVESAP